MKYKKGLIGIASVLGTGAIVGAMKYMKQVDSKEKDERENKRLKYLNKLNRGVKGKQYRIVDKSKVCTLKAEDVDLCEVLTEAWRYTGMLDENEVVTFWYNED